MTVPRGKMRRRGVRRRWGCEEGDGAECLSGIGLGNKDGGVEWMSDVG